MLYHKKGCRKMKLKFSLSVTIGFQFILNSLYSTTVSVYKTKNFHTFCNNTVTIIIDIREVFRCSFSIETSGIHYFNTVIVLIKLHRTIALIVSVANSVHQEFSSSPMRIIHFYLFSQCRYKHRLTVCN